MPASPSASDGPLAPSARVIRRCFGPAVLLARPRRRIMPRNCTFWRGQPIGVASSLAGRTKSRGDRGELVVAERKQAESPHAPLDRVVLPKVSMPPDVLFRSSGRGLSS